MPRPDLDRAGGLSWATAMVVGTIIGASIFVQPSEITGQVPTVFGVFLVWAVSGLLTLMGALVAAELASTFDRTGGVYVYLTEAYSPAMGFLWGWAMFWTMHSGIIAAIAVVFARYLGWLVPLGSWGEKGAAVGAILVLTAVNYRGVKQGAAVQAAFTGGKLLAVGLIILVGFALGGGSAEGAGVSALASFGIVANQVAAEPGNSLAGLVLVLVGLPVYYLWGRNRSKGSEA